MNRWRNSPHFMPPPGSLARRREGTGRCLASGLCAVPHGTQAHLVGERDDRLPEEGVAVVDDPVELPEDLEADQTEELRPGGGQAGRDRARQGAVRLVQQLADLVG